MAGYPCKCYFCGRGEAHPERHTQWFRISDHLLVAESLLDSDRVPMEACKTCGHTREMQVN